ncbi:TPA: hypothetical protein ACPSKE_001073 [Legionella feeleii]
MNLLIATEPDDAHAIITKLALEQKGYACTLWYTADMPSRQANSIYINNGGLEWIPESGISDELYDLETNPFDIVWWRRARLPYIPDAIQVEDCKCARKENIAFFESLSTIIAPDAFWINPLDTQRRANSKASQLKIASQCGFKIPTTLMSNSPSHIKGFTKKFQNRGVIYKSFLPNYWKNENGVRAMYTARVHESQFPNDELLQLVPGIFQVEIKKKYELRVTCFGEKVVAVKIDSQKHEKGRIDWRRIANQDLKIKPYILDQNTMHKIKRFMKCLGIVFGCFDFIVSTDNELYFLEINEQGQFLWIEEVNPEINMLETWIQFLTDEPLFCLYRNRPEQLSTKQFISQVNKIKKEKIKRHVYLNEIT